jgi:hypothetical protein
MQDLILDPDLRSAGQSVAQTNHICKAEEVIREMVAGCLETLDSTFQNACGGTV